MNTEPGCRLPAVNAPRHPARTQTAAAAEFIRKHRSQIAFVTLIIGGNDVLIPCVRDPQFADCVRSRLPRMRSELRRTLQELRSAGGQDLRIVGLTYPDIFLGAWVWPGVPHERATATVGVFETLFNPVLAEEYARVGATFVDITSATGAYVPLDQTTSAGTYGVVPRAVATACELTFYCEHRDVHARTAGYRFIAERVIDALGPS
jgi:lysophospholipase L1-like esterase